MSKSRALKFALAFGFAVFTTNAQASTVSSYDAIHSIDTTTNLLWLDMSETIGKSWNYVSSQLGVGGDYEGYRFATTEEISQLWTDADITTQPYIGTANSEFSAIQLLMGLLSPTYLYNSETAVYAMDNLVRVALLYTFVAPNGGLGSQIAKANFQTGNPAIADTIFASYLVKNAPAAVPIPAALPLFAAGLGAMGFMGWRRRRTTSGATVPHSIQNS